MDNDIIMFGKYKNHTYISIFEKDLYYCEWVLNLKNVKNTKVLQFQNYLSLRKLIKSDTYNKYIECIVCNENTELYTKLKCCNNNLCNICLIKINNFNCPFCRKNIENMIDTYTKEIKKYIIEKDKKLNNKEYIINMYKEKNNEINYSLKYIVENKNINIKTIMGILNECLEDIEF